MSNWKSKILKFGKYTWSEITAMVEDGYIPVANADELDALRNTTAQTMGVGSIWEDTYTTGLDKKYIQINNIDLSTYIAGNPSKFAPFASVTDIANGFRGVYDGNKLAIKNMYMKYVWAKCSIFGSIVNATLVNILIENAVIEQTDCTRLNAILYCDALNCTINNIVIKDSIASGYYYSSGLGNLTTDSYITNVQLIGIELYPVIISAKHSGGIISELSNSSLSNSCCTGRLIFPDSTYRYYRTGGLVGRNISGSTISNCWSDMYIEASGNTDVGVGGLVGQNYGLILNCYSRGKIIQKPGFTVPIGGLVGKNETGGVVTNSYYDSETSGLSDTGKGLPRTTAQMLQGTADSIVAGEAMYTGWSNNIWNFRTNLKYPKLKKL